MSGLWRSPFQVIVGNFLIDFALYDISVQLLSYPELTCIKYISPINVEHQLIVHATFAMRKKRLCRYGLNPFFDYFMEHAASKPHIGSADLFV